MSNATNCDIPLVGGIRQLAECDCYVQLAARPVLLYNVADLSFYTYREEHSEEIESLMQAKLTFTTPVKAEIGYGTWTFESRSGYLSNMAERYSSGYFVPKFIFGDFLIHEPTLILAVRTFGRWIIGASK